VAEPVAEPVGEGVAAASGPWRGIDDLAALVGAYCWLEHRLFELTGRWAAETGDRDGSEAVDAECRVWCAASSRRHGALAGRWAERLPVRAGVDASALVRAPEGPLGPALGELAATGAIGGIGLLIETVLPWVGGLYASHLSRASPVSEAPVIEVLVEARRAAAGEVQGGRPLLQRLPSGAQPSRHVRKSFERALAHAGILPAVRPS
jgi:hypothetical protein